MSPENERCRRMGEQRWLLDKVIESVGIDFCWPISHIAMGTPGPIVAGDVMSVRMRCKKYADISREFTRIAAKREGMAKKAEAEGHLVTARDNYYAAAVFYGSAQWAFHDDDIPENIWLNDKKIECYKKYIEHAPHPVERVEIPFEGKSCPGYLHLPLMRSAKIPCVISIDGMDNFKEAMHPLQGDNLMERGIAVFSMDGPGQGECNTRKIRCTTDNFPKATQAALEYLAQRPEIDSNKIGISGTSMGSFWVTQSVANEPRFKAAAVMLSCHEPGMNTIFNKASPTFKARYMWMAGYHDEDAFDKFAKTLTLKGTGAKIKCPFLIVAGGDDELSPVENSYNLYREIQGPKKIVVYEGELHELEKSQLEAQVLVADWLRDRLDGKPMQSESIIIDGLGREIKK
jgi:dipeptidyl aminopeptidase/acylaminoacyl peptidase